MYSHVYNLLARRLPFTWRQCYTSRCSFTSRLPRHRLARSCYTSLPHIGTYAFPSKYQITMQSSFVLFDIPTYNYFFIVTQLAKQIGRYLIDYVMDATIDNVLTRYLPPILL